MSSECKSDQDPAHTLLLIRILERWWESDFFKLLELGILISVWINIYFNTKIKFYILWMRSKNVHKSWYLCCSSRGLRVDLIRYVNLYKIFVYVNGFLLDSPIFLMRTQSVLSYHPIQCTGIKTKYCLLLDLGNAFEIHHVFG